MTRRLVLYHSSYCFQCIIPSFFRTINRNELTVLILFENFFLFFPCLSGIFVGSYDF